MRALYSIRSERAFCERLNYDLLFKWFLDLRIDEPAFDATTFSKNRRRLFEHEVADRFLARVPSSAAPLPVQRPLLRRRHPAGSVGVLLTGAVYDNPPHHRPRPPSRMKTPEKAPPPTGQSAQDRQTVTG